MDRIKLPEGLREETISYMNDVISRLRNNDLLDNVDKAALVMLARNYDTFLIASEDVAKNGLTFMSIRGVLQENPSVKIARDAQNSALKIMVEFGLTAKSRSKVKSQKTDEETPFEAFVNNA